MPFSYGESFCGRRSGSAGGQRVSCQRAALPRRGGCRAGWRPQSGLAAAASARRPHDRRLPVEEVVADRSGRAGHRRVLLQVLQLLVDPLGGRAHGRVQRRLSGLKIVVGAGGELVEAYW